MSRNPSPWYPACTRWNQNIADFKLPPSDSESEMPRTKWQSSFLHYDLHAYHGNYFNITCYITWKILLYDILSRGLGSRLQSSCYKTHSKCYIPPLLYNICFIYTGITEIFYAHPKGYVLQVLIAFVPMSLSRSPGPLPSQWNLIWRLGCVIRHTYLLQYNSIK